MTDTQSLFGLSGTDYWDDPLKGSRVGIDRYVYGERWGIYIDGPAKVDLSERESVPLIVFAALSPADAALPLEHVAKLVVCDVERRTVQVTSAVPPKDEPPRSGPRSSKPRSVGSSQSHVNDLATTSGVREPGAYVATVLLRDQASNRVRIAVERTPRGYQDPAVVAFLEAQRRDAPPPPPAPASPRAGDPLPTFRPVEGAPPPPAQEGLEAAVPRLVVAKAGARAVLSVSFRLRARREDVVPAEAARPRGLQSSREDEYGKPRPTAIVPITLVITGSELPGERVTRLRVPTWDAVPADGGVVTGQVSLDLFDEPHRLDRTPQTCFLTLFCGEHMSGPHSLAVVSEAMLQKR
jgi:hypothetical protein